ncbi:MAG: lipocalin family protein [Candidatus Cryptobacteroides sp.]
MVKRIFILTGCLCAAMSLFSCGSQGVEGRWTAPVPGMEGQEQGFELRKDGTAESVNMATLQYRTWERTDDRLILTGESIGNGITIPFRDTLTIESIENDRLTLRKGDLLTEYSKR